MKKLIIIFSCLVLILLGGTTVFANHDDSSQTGCNRNNPKNCPSPTQICGNGEHTGNPHCVTPTATPTPTKKPKCWKDCVTPTVTPTPTKGPNCGNVEVYEPCPTLTVSPTPTAGESGTPTPSVTSPNTQEGGSSGKTDTTQAPGPAVCNVSFQAPVLQGFTANGNGSVTFSWWPSPNVSKYSITYGYQPDQLIYGEDNIPASSTSITLNGLIIGHNVWAIVQAWQGGCAESSNELDPKVR